MDRRCADCRELISAYLDGELSIDERAWLRGHLAACEECRAVLDGYRRIGVTIRSMQPVQAPADLTQAIYARTIDAAPHRLVLFTSRLGYSLGAVAAVLLIFVVAGYLLLGGYQRSVSPKVASSDPHSGEVIQPQDSIEIHFNKEMNRESVESAFGMQPIGTEDGLMKTWDGNTLIVSGKPFAPDSEYVITISSEARDKWGNSLEDDFTLKFSTRDTVAFTTPTAVPPTPTPSPTQATDDDEQAPVTPEDAPTESDDLPPTGVDDSTPTPAPATGGGDDEDTNDDGDIGAVEPTATATATPRTDPATATSTRTPTLASTPTPTAAPTEPPATVTATPTTPPATPTPPATMTATATATATLEPTLTPTPDVIPVTGGIGSVYWGNASVQQRLGEALDYAATTSVQSLGFQRGSMLYREDEASIYVMPTDSGLWDRYGASLDDLPDPAPAEEPGLYVPGGIIGFLWQENAAIQEQMGHAHAEYATASDATFQIFEHGTIIVFDGNALILYDDGTKDFLAVS